MFDAPGRWPKRRSVAGRRVILEVTVCDLQDVITNCDRLRLLMIELVIELVIESLESGTVIFEAKVIRADAGRRAVAEYISQRICR